MVLDPKNPMGMQRRSNKSKWNLEWEEEDEDKLEVKDMGTQRNYKS